MVTRQDLESSLRTFEGLHRVWMNTSVFTESGDRARTMMLREGNRHAWLREQYYAIDQTESCCLDNEKGVTEV